MDDAVTGLDIEKVQSLWEKMDREGIAAEVRKMQIDNSLHKKAFQIAVADELAQHGLLRDLLAFAFVLGKKDYCSRSATVAVIQDVFDVISVDRCEKLFNIIEENLSEWKTPHFFESCRNLVLRMCNDLLKRLSRTVNTSFCGQILVLLARALPLCEKSGLNLASRFNVDNVTNYETEETSKEAEALLADGEDMETGEIKETRDVPVDYSLYVKFWQLQSFFSSPPQCYENTKWRIFHHNTSEVLDMLLSHKLETLAEEDDELPKKRRKEEILDLLNTSAFTPSVLNSSLDSDCSCFRTSDSFVAKYLTSQKLLQLQLNDSQFRRYFLVQCLILYQYLLSDMKFKDKAYVLSDEQIRFIVESTEKCYNLIRETHPKGSHFANCIKRILEREKEWSDWKNGGCFDYTVLADSEKMGVFKRRPRAKYDASKLDLGNPELTKLWNINPDMLSACEDRKRKFAPAVADFIRDPLDELDPEQQVEDQYKAVNDEAFQWRATRLLMYRSTAYFQLPSKRNEVISAIGPFLEEVVKQTASTIPELHPLSNGSVAEQKVDVSVDGILKNGEEKSASYNGFSKDAEASSQVSNYLVKELSPLLAKEWQTLADALGTDKSRCQGLEANDAVKYMLNEWRKTDGYSATVKKLSSILLSAGIFTEQIGDVLKKASKEVLSS